MATQAPQPLGSVQHPGTDGGRESEQTPPGALTSGRTRRVPLIRFLDLRNEEDAPYPVHLQDQGGPAWGL